MAALANENLVELDSHSLIYPEKTFVELKKLSLNQRNSNIDIRSKKHLFDLKKFFIGFYILIMDEKVLVLCEK